MDITNVNINMAPNNDALLEQKIETMDPVTEWWFQSLMDGQISNMEFGGSQWQNTLVRKPLREAFSAFARDRGISTWRPSASSFGRKLRKVCPKMFDRRLGPRNNRYWVYEVPGIEECRLAFEKFMRHKIKWPDISEPLDSEDLLK